MEIGNELTGRGLVDVPGGRRYQSRVNILQGKILVLVIYSSDVELIEEVGTVEPGVKVRRQDSRPVISRVHNPQLGVRVGLVVYTSDNLEVRAVLKDPAVQGIIAVLDGTGDFFVAVPTGSGAYLLTKISILRRSDFVPFTEQMGYPGLDAAR